MKKHLLLFILFSFSSKIKAQIVFCPPGAEWNYLFNGDSQYAPGTYRNEKIKYIGDTILGADTVKLLSHIKMFIACGPNNFPDYKTFIKQKGDTVFLKNFLTNNSWQILYNFACSVGQSWQATVHNRLHTYTVQSVSTVIENGISLKKMDVYSAEINYGYTISERYGASRFLFMFSLNNIFTSCHGNNALGILCYRDDVFGLKQFTDYSCNFSNTVAIEELIGKTPNIHIFPNPVSEVLSVEFDYYTAPLELGISDVRGVKVQKVALQQTNKIDLTKLEEGMYFLTILENKKVIYKSKIIKEN